MSPHDFFNAVARTACDGIRLPALSRWTGSVCGTEGDRAQLGMMLLAGAALLAILVVYELKRRSPAPGRRRRWDALD